MSTVVNQLANSTMGRNLGNGSPYLGESFTAVAGTLQQIQVRLGDTFQGTVPFHVLVTTMVNGHPGTVLFESNTVTVPNIGGQNAFDQSVLVTYTIPVTGVTNLTPGVQARASRSPRRRACWPTTPMPTGTP